jgi:hypothetical protein
MACREQKWGWLGKAADIPKPTSLRIVIVAPVTFRVPGWLIASLSERR